MATRKTSSIINNGFAVVRLFVKWHQAATWQRCLSWALDVDIANVQGAFNRNTRSSEIFAIHSFPIGKMIHGNRILTGRIDDEVLDGDGPPFDSFLRRRVNAVIRLRIVGGFIIKRHVPIQKSVEKRPRHTSSLP